MMLQDKVVVVAGVGSGLGRAIALASAREGADVVLAARTAARLDDVAKEVTGLGRRALAVPTDLADAAAADHLAEAALDGLYAVRTSLPETALDDAATVKSYKSLSLVERAIRSIKTVNLQVRPVYHWLADRVRAHVFLCMLGYYLEWHMRQRLAPMLYDDDDKEAAEALRASVVANDRPPPLPSRLPDAPQTAFLSTASRR